MVAQTADEMIARARKTTTNDPGMCLWYSQEWFASPHMYPDATSQWQNAKRRVPGDRTPPKGAHVCWTGGSKGHGHSAVTIDDKGTIRTIDQQSSGKTTEVPLSEIEKDWGLTYAGWTADIGGVDIPYLVSGGNPTNPNGVKVGDLVYVTANGGLKERTTPGGDPTGTIWPQWSQFVVAELVDGWARRDTSSSAAHDTSRLATPAVAQASSELVDVKATGYLLGIDVSSNNGDDWKSDPSWQYGWVKATEGRSYVNPDYAEQLQVVRGRGLAGHYHWLNDGDVQAQVDWFIANADVRPGELIAVDWEDKSNPTTAQKDQAIRALQAAYPANKVGLYCNRDWWWNHDTSSFYGDYLWIAIYGAGDPGIEAEWTFWQFTSTPYDQNYGRFADLAALQAWAGADSPPPAETGSWFSTDYLYPQVKPDPTNPNMVKAGDTVQVTASGGLTARQQPGGPKSLDKNGQVLIRPTGYEFTVTGDLVDGWVTGGTNWYSSDYLMVAPPEPEPSKPGWKATPAKVLPLSKVPGSVSYLQGVARVDPVTCDDGTSYGEAWIVGQDYNNAGDLRFLLYDSTGTFQSWFQVNDAGHGQTFYAYRSAAGNLYVWCGENPAYRYPWQPGKKVSKSSGTKMDYKGARPQCGYHDRIGFRDATDTTETFALFDRTDFTDGTNRTKPLRQVTISKRTGYTQQSWACDENRIYRLMGSTDESCTAGKTGKHILDVFDWAGACLLSKFDVTAMHQAGASECEPEGLTFAGKPGELLACKREGPASASKRSYVAWTMTGLP